MFRWAVDSDNSLHIMNIDLPFEWTARPHQIPFMSALLPEHLGGRGLKRACIVWHRRAGKDSASINFTAVASHDTIATYWHMLPTAVQGRKVIWDAIDPRTGIRTIDQAWPREIRKSVNNTEMRIELKNGSIWQVVGSDNYDNLVGANPFGVVFSEYSVSDPRAWDYIRPILKENGGWAIFIYTSRGKNHGHTLYKMAEKNDLWFAELLDIEHTFRQDGSPVFTQEQYQEELDDGMDLLLAKQEYYCSFDAGLFGSYYADEMSKAKFGDYPWNPRKPVHTFWDLGLRDATAIWFLQESEHGDAINAIDYMEESNVPLIDWCKRINQLPYSYGIHSGPHDIKRRDYSDGKSYLKTAGNHGVSFEVTPDIGLRPGIDATKAFIPRIRFNTALTSKGTDALYNYRREYNDKLRVFMDRPIHDWASHGADAFRGAAISWPENYRAQGGERFKVIPAIKTAGGRRRKKIPRIARGR